MSSVISGEGITRKNHASTRFISQPRETLAQFLVIDLWIAVHVEVNKGNKVASFWVDFIKTMESSFLNASLPRPADKAGECIRLRKGLHLAVQPTVEPVAKAQAVRP